MKGFLVTCVFGLCSLFAQAQYQKMLNVLEDVQTETTDGKFTLRFFDALTGDPVNNASVSIKEVGNFTSDAAGKIVFPIQKDGIYNFDFVKDNYISATYKFEVVANTIFYNRFSVSPRIELGALRIVLDWDRKPNDLDLHLVKEGNYHISFRDKISAEDGAVKLDRDDMDGYGPETITLKETDNRATYTCFVQDYSNLGSSRSTQLAKSKAIIRVYNNNELTDTFYVPTDTKGNKWSVFQIENGKIKGIYSIQNAN